MERPFRIGRVGAVLLAMMLGASPGFAQPQGGGGGLAARQPSGPGETFIVGGEPTTIDRHPWQVGLLIRDADGLKLCGGAMVARNWVLTAAPCVIPTGDSVMRVRSGVTEIRDGATAVSVDKTIIHARYDASSFENDIALVKTRAPMTGEVVRLPTADYRPPVGALLEVTGWGATAEGGAASAQLMRAELPLVPLAECNAPDVYDGRIRDGMICAGRADGSVDACQGDSGGPLVDRSAGAAVLVGVVSWGEGCGRERRYGVYTDVAAYERWIKETILVEEQ